MGISLDKISQQAPGLLSLAKAADAVIDKSRLNGQTAKVAVMLDFSGSMSQQYRSGAMQRLTEKVLALGTQFDDDGAIDFFVFDNNSEHLGEVSITDFEGSVARLTRGRSMGRTYYEKAILKVRDQFGFGNAAPAKRSLFGFKKATSDALPADQPVYVLFLTDGKPDDPELAAKAVAGVSHLPIFWKFISIGPSKIKFLQDLDDMSGRFMDNADYKHVSDVDALSDVDLFDALLEEFPEWILEARSKGLIK